MVICCVPLCKSRSDRGKNINTDGLKITFHKFPKNDKRKREWARVINRRGNNVGQLWEPINTSVVCSLHFSSPDFKPGLKLRSLSKLAIPNAFDYFSLNKPKKRSKKQKKDIRKTIHSSENQDLEVEISPNTCAVSYDTAVSQIKHCSVPKNLSHTAISNVKVLPLCRQKKGFRRQNKCVRAARNSSEYQNSEVVRFVKYSAVADVTPVKQTKDISVSTRMTSISIMKKKQEHLMLLQKFRRLKKAHNLIKLQVSKLAKENESLKTILRRCNIVKPHPKPTCYVIQQRVMPDLNHSLHTYTVRPNIVQLGTQLRMS